MRLCFLSHGSYLLSFTCLVFGISITWFSTSRRPVQCWESCLLSIQGTYGYICYFHIKININIPVYLITPALLPHLCANEIELKVSGVLGWLILDE